MLAINEVVAAGAAAELWELLALSVGYPTAEKMSRVREAYCANEQCLVAAAQDGQLVGVAGYAPSAHEVEILHIAVHPSARRGGIGGELVASLSRRFPTLPLMLETHDDAVGFYRSLNFEAQTVTTKWGTRWRCTRQPLG